MRFKMNISTLTAHHSNLFEIEAELEAAFDQIQEEREMTGNISDESSERCVRLFQISSYSMNDRSGTVGSVRAKRTSTLHGLRELVGLVKIPEVIRIIHTVMEAAASQGIPGINAERTTVSKAAAEDFCLA